MASQLITLGIQAVLRAAQAGADLYREGARDKPVFLPNIELPEGTRETELIGFLTANPRLIAEKDALRAVWDAQLRTLSTDDPGLLDAAFAVLLEHRARIALVSAGGRAGAEVDREAKMLAAGRMVEQWREERRPPSAAVRMALTLTDIGLEYVGANPSILGVSARGEKLIVSFADNLSALIPDDTAAFGPRVDFADRVTGIFLRAGLGALSDSATTVLRDEDMARLLPGVVKPIVDALPSNIAEQFAYRELIDAMAGPAAEAVFRLLGEDLDGYFGRRFADDKALGVVTGAVFGEIASITQTQGSLVEAFSSEGLVKLYQSALAVAIDRPDLFISGDATEKQRLFRELLTGAAAILRNHPRLEGPVGGALAALVLDALGSRAPALLKLDRTEPWERVAVQVLDQLVSGLSTGLSGGQPLSAFSDGELLELARTVLEQIAATPGMVGAQRTEVKAIVAGIVEAMAADDNLLLSPDEWTVIAAVAAREAAANPGRLFGLDAGDPAQALATQAIKILLQAAQQAWSGGERSAKSVIFGETLTQAIAIVLEALSGNIAGLTAAPEKFQQLVDDLMARLSAAPDRFGSDGFLRALQAAVSSLFADGTVPTDQLIDAALSA